MDLLKVYLGKLLGVMVVVFVFSACQEDTASIEMNDLDIELLHLLEQEGGADGLDHFKLPESNELSKIPQDPRNPLTSIKVQLGKKLFFETGLAINPRNESGQQTYSCASCHVPGSCFQAGIKQGIGEGGLGFGIAGENRLPNQDYEIEDLDIQPIRTPTVLHVAYNKTSLWNGQFGAVGLNEGTEANWTNDTPKATNHLGYHGTEIQAIAGLKVHRMGANDELIQTTYYKDLFDMAFPEFDPIERYSVETIGLAIAAFERTIIGNKAPFQNWLKGNYGALTHHQKLGASLFFGKAACNNCHNGPALNSESFFALGMEDLNGAGFYDTFTEDNLLATAKGRGGFTGNTVDDFKFKTPQLYGLKAMKFLGHGASFTSVKEVIEYKNNGITENVNVPLSQVTEDFKPLGLTDDEINQLTDFVENGLDDNEMERYVTSSVASGNCFPNNDVISQLDMGCD